MVCAIPRHRSNFEVERNNEKGFKWEKKLDGVL